MANNTAAIMYLTDSEDYGRDSVARQYFMQLAQYVKLPMISWNADNSAFEMGSLQANTFPVLECPFAVLEWPILIKTPEHCPS